MCSSARHSLRPQTKKTYLGSSLDVASNCKLCKTLCSLVQTLPSCLAEIEHYKVSFTTLVSLVGQSHRVFLLPRLVLQLPRSISNRQCKINGQSYWYPSLIAPTPNRVSHNALFWKSQTHSVNDTINDFDWVFLEIPVKICIVGMLLTCPIGLVGGALPTIKWVWWWSPLNLPNL